MNLNITKTKKLYDYIAFAKLMLNAFPKLKRVIQKMKDFLESKNWNKKQECISRSNLKTLVIALYIK